MKLLTIQYKISANGFQPGQIITVEDNEYVRARIGSHFRLISEQDTEAPTFTPVPEVPKPKGRRKKVETVPEPEPEPEAAAEEVAVEAPVEEPVETEEA